jgi:hypothetical protein
MPVWLLAEPSGGGGPQRFAAKVASIGPHLVVIEFEPGSAMTDKGMRGTSGAPFVDAEGKVVGLLCGGGEDGDRLVATINPVTAVRPMIAAASTR